jgi:AhpD family alkylhydroperoxidase
MTRQNVYSDIEQTLGIVPSFLKALPDYSLESEWNLFKAGILGETAIPNKYKELIGVAVSAATKCRYCTLFHTEAAKLHGATEAEIEDAVHFSKASAGWSAYMHGLQIDFDEFKGEMGQIVDYLTSQAGQSPSVSQQGRTTEVGAHA